MMNKEQKKNYIEEMTSKFENSKAVMVTHYQGLTMTQLDELRACLLYTSPSPRDLSTSRMPSSA